jgi:hypothetical protein
LEKGTHSEAAKAICMRTASEQWARASAQVNIEGRDGSTPVRAKLTGESSV